MRVAVHGSYYARNFGDTLIVKIICQWLEEAVGRDNVYLAVPGHAEEQKEIGYPVLDPTLRHTITHLVFAGGGYFGEPNLPLRERYNWYLRNYRRHLSWTRDYAAARKAIFGIGIGPISDPFFRGSVRGLFKGMQSAFVRDDTSLEFARRYGLNADKVRLGIDLALSVSQATNAPSYAFGVHLSSMPENVLEEVIGVLSSKPLDDGRRPSIMFLADTPMSRGSLKRYEALARLVGCPLKSCEYNGVDDLMQRIASCEAIITSKLHVGIVASALGRKVISIPVHPKTRRFYKDLSLEEFCLEGERLNPGEIARLLSKEMPFAFDRDEAAKRIAEMRVELNEFVHGKGWADQLEAA
jgi:polysaccharide pyruvyl transferase WcaK-like protein